MSHTQRMAGFARGSVKCREYLMFVLEVKTIEALRAEFLEHHGAIYEIL